MVVIDDAARAVPLARTLGEAGISLVEITLRTARARDAAAAIVQEVPEIAVGLGTVTRPEHIEAAAAIGARFAVSPGLHPDLVRCAADVGLPYLPGICTATEVMQAMTLKLDVLKFFPAELAGGTALLQQFESLFPEMAFCPTGGIDDGNMREYLALANVPCVGGSWLVPRELLAAADWPALRTLAQNALAA